MYIPSTPQMSGDEFFAEVARDILSYVSRDLSDQVSDGADSHSALKPARD